MKPILITFFWMLGCIAYSQEATPPVIFKLNKGDKLIYDVRHKGDLYYYTIQIVECGPKYIYHWEMGEPKNKKGSVEIKTKAMNQSMKITTRVKPNEHLLLEDACILWISKALFKALANNSQPEITIDETTGNKMALLQKSNFTFRYKGAALTSEVLEVSNQQKFFDLKQFSVLNNPDNPLIVKLNMGFTAELIEIK
ncbi:MAG: hypothetical protein N2167_05175 [Flavobacteriales bacterium]|nr:hypothetical protein [Flavobacteriales bacterium]